MNEEEEFVPPDGGYGWIILFATTAINVCLLPLVQCFGIIYQNDFEAMGITAAEKSLLLHLHNAIFCSLGLIGSPLLKKYSYRQVALFGSSLMCFGILLSSFAKSYIHLIFSVSVLMGIGQGILLPATYVATNTYFKKRLTLAMSLSVTGASLSPIFMPQVCNKLLAHLGTRNTVLILFAISLIAILSCFLLKPVKRPQRTKIKEEIHDIEKLSNGQKPELSQDEAESELLPPPIPADGIVYQETTTPIVKKTRLTKISNLFNLELLKERPFVVVLIGMSLSYASELNIILMIQFILPELSHFDRSDVASALSIQSTADIVGRLGIPLAAHLVNAPPKVMYAASLVTSTLARTLLAFFCDSKYTVLFSCVLVGLAKGTKAIFQSVIIPKHVSLEKLPAATGLNMLFSGTLSLIIGPLIGVIHDVSKSYIYALHAASVISTVCVILWIIDYFTAVKKVKESPKT